MITKISKKDIDTHSVPVKHKVSSPIITNPDYRNVVVNKPWGYEYLLFENKHVAIWVLFLKQGGKTSMHCHPKKMTSLLVLEGVVKTSSLGDHYDLQTLEGIVIDNGVFHSTSTDFKTGAFVMEIETPPEKSDLVRLNDQYGRENKGYEGEHSMSRDLEKYDYHSLHDEIEMERKIVEKIIKKSKIALHTQEDWDNLNKETKDKKFCMMSFLDRDLVDHQGNIVLRVGEICEGDWFFKKQSIIKPLSGLFTVLTVY